MNLFLLKIILEENKNKMRNTKFFFIRCFHIPHLRYQEREYTHSKNVAKTRWKRDVKIFEIKEPKISIFDEVEFLESRENVLTLYAVGYYICICNVFFTIVYGIILFTHTYSHVFMVNQTL